MPADTASPGKTDSSDPTSRVRTARIVAIVSGLLGFVLALTLPFLPVRQETGELQWPQNGSIDSVEAPLVTYAPLTLRASVPCAAAAQLGSDGGTLVSTIPSGSPDATAEGLVIRAIPGEDGAPGTVEAVLRNSVLVSAPLDEPCTAVTVASNSERTAAEIVGADPPVAIELEGDERPQMVGVFSDLGGPAGAFEPDGDDSTERLSVRAELDSRFTSTPTVLKLLAMIVCALATLVSLVALHRLDGIDGRRARRFLPARWWRFTLVDAVVVSTLLLWHIIGANTSDDGYILNMARVSGDAGYMANYFRWFGVPEAPFGWFYDVLVVFAQVSTSSVWMRLPTLIAAILCWMVISREVIPRLGVAVRHSRVSLWTAGLVFLAFWLPYNNGLRPEPIIAVGALLTWCSIERAIATGRMLPAAIAVLIAAFSLAAGPTGLIAVAALVAGMRPLVKVLIARRHLVGVVAPLAPILASGTVVLIAVFADQTLASVLEATRVRSAVGPNVPWFDERLRWDALLTVSPDGSLARRFGVFVMLLCLVVCVMLILRKGRIPGTAIGPSRRILGIVFASLLLMMLTPTKWTHHFGVYAGLAASVAALAAIGVGSVGIRSARNRALFTAGVLFVLAMAFTGSNGWWYVSSYGIPWWDKPPSISGYAFSTALLGLTVLALLLAAWFHLREPFTTPRPDRNGRVRALASAPLTLVAAAVVLFEVLSLLKGAVSQYPAYSIAKSNAAALTGNSCGLADEVLVESEPNATMLQPLDGDAGEALGAGTAVGFTPNGVALDLTADAETTTTGGANTVDSEEGGTTTSTSAGTEGGRTSDEGINGSTVKLPFGLDPQTTPVLGSYRSGVQQSAELESGWYALPERTDETPLLVVTAAGRIRYVDPDGVITPGQDVLLEFGSSSGDDVTPLATLAPIDIGPSPSWRNLRVPSDAIPADADAVRIVVDDGDLSPDQWVAVTPPRMPRMQTLQEVVGSDAPVLIDWSVGLAFPCQRPFGHRNGVAEVPEYRILPDRVGADATNGWQDDIGGGPLGWIPLLLNAEAVPTYLNHDWDRDWGSLEQYRPIDPDASPAEVTTDVTTRSGLWSPGRIRDGVPVLLE
ncbi:arabinosyltransferase [Rhodococcus sp. 852002-51564_SCH6189132-a]|uniref:arabinosyltransferase domain-containing protein n=1 Tax=Rhodococcus TaxID=1827 RepID=UPI0007EC2222|nr:MULTISPECIES: arabinosyltransferase domain-containing protein [Rhodococcus]MCD5419334.1 arabinosyltransferase domain-containing protein [Rhodococcus pyridinivorans]OBA30382.1 arabinosyltransferase [Rhodococcus sp. 852002-51564_SCH6189132-a]